MKRIGRYRRLRRTGMARREAWGHSGLAISIIVENKPDLIWLRDYLTVEVKRNRQK